MAYPDDGSHRLFVVEQHTARIMVVPRQARDTFEATVLPAPRPHQPGKRGGPARAGLPPQVQGEPAVLRLLFGQRSRDPAFGGLAVLDGFARTTGSPTRASEQRIWVSAKDPFENHNGGTIAFGPDGYLYITLGDSGAADDPLLSGQNPRDWFASILRIDVDHPEGGKAYGIPKDNPAQRDPKYAHWAPEVYCIGLRNVWKFSFDRKTGDLWAGDVGQNLWEMVHRIENGGNYGWSIREGFHPFHPERRQRPDPAATHPAADRRVSPRADRANGPTAA